MSGIRDFTMIKPPCVIEECNRKARHKETEETKVRYGTTCSYHHSGPGKPDANNRKMARGCENKDGHVTGTKCTTTITDPGQLHWDHINGNIYDKRPENIQVLCASCHHVKGQINGDHSNQGSKRHKSNMEEFFSVEGTIMNKKPEPIQKKITGKRNNDDPFPELREAA